MVARYWNWLNICFLEIIKNLCSHEHKRFFCCSHEHKRISFCYCMYMPKCIPTHFCTWPEYVTHYFQVWLCMKQFHSENFRLSITFMRIGITCARHMLWYKMRLNVQYYESYQKRWLVLLQSRTLDNFPIRHYGQCNLNIIFLYR